MIFDFSKLVWTEPEVACFVEHIVQKNICVCVCIRKKRDRLNERYKRNLSLVRNCLVKAYSPPHRRLLKIKWIAMMCSTFSEREQNRNYHRHREEDGRQEEWDFDVRLCVFR